MGIAISAGCGTHGSESSHAYPKTSGGETWYAAPELPPIPGHTRQPAASPQPQEEQVDALHESASYDDVEADSGGDSEVVATAAQPPPAPPPQAPPLPQPTTDIAVDDQAKGPILIYTASFMLSVYEVKKAQLELKEAAIKLGGFVSAQTDTMLTLRVPAAAFEQALSAIEATGNVRARNVEAHDIGEQYRDLHIRLRTAEAIRTRLEAMLARAQNVEEALKVERELDRVVRQIELLKGQLRALDDRIAFSTLVIAFSPEARPDLDDSEVFRLPYPWLDELGLHRLLELEHSTEYSP